MPAAFASASAGFSASGLLGLNTIASTPAAISVRRSASWPAGSVLCAIMLTDETWPDASASASAVQFCSSRKPLPVPPVFENPIVYCFAASLGASLAAWLAGSLAGGASVGAAADGAAVAAPPPLLQAP